MVIFDDDALKSDDHIVKDVHGINGINNKLYHVFTTQSQWLRQHELLAVSCIMLDAFTPEQIAQLTLLGFVEDRISAPKIVACKPYNPDLIFHPFTLFSKFGDKDMTPLDRYSTGLSLCSRYLNQTNASKRNVKRELRWIDTISSYEMRKEALSGPNLITHISDILRCSPRIQNKDKTILEWHLGTIREIHRTVQSIPPRHTLYYTYRLSLKSLQKDFDISELKSVSKEILHNKCRELSSYVLHDSGMSVHEVLLTLRAMGNYLYDSIGGFWFPVPFIVLESIVLKEILPNMRREKSASVSIRSLINLLTSKIYIQQLINPYVQGGFKLRYDNNEEFISRSIAFQILSLFFNGCDLLECHRFNNHTDEASHRNSVLNLWIESRKFDQIEFAIETLLVKLCPFGLNWILMMAELERLTYCTSSSQQDIQNISLHQSSASQTCTLNNFLKKISETVERYVSYPTKLSWCEGQENSEIYLKNGKEKLEKFLHARTFVDSSRDENMNTLFCGYNGFEFYVTGRNNSENILEMSKREGIHPWLESECGYGEPVPGIVAGFAIPIPGKGSLYSSNFRYIFNRICEDPKNAMNYKFLCETKNIWKSPQDTEIAYLPHISLPDHLNERLIILFMLVGSWFKNTLKYFTNDAMNDEVMSASFRNLRETPTEDGNSKYSCPNEMRTVLVRMASRS